MFTVFFVKTLEKCIFILTKCYIIIYDFECGVNLRIFPDETKVLITAKNDCLVVEPIEGEEIEKHPYSMIKGFQKSGKNGRALYFSTSLIDYIEI